MADDTSATYPDDCVYNTHHVWARLVKEPRLKGIVTLVDNKPPKPSKSRKPAKGKVAEEVAAKAAAPSKSSKKAAPKKEAAPAKPVKKASKKVEAAPVVEAVAPAKPVKKASKKVEVAPVVEAAAPAKPVKKASKNVEAAPVVEAAAPAKPVKKASKKVEAAPVVEAVAPSKPMKKASKNVEAAPAKPVKKASKSRGKGAVAPKPLVEYDMEEYDNVAYVGITDYLADELGGIDSIDVPLEGDELEMDSLVIHIHVRNRIRHFRCPLTGRVLAVNQDVLDDPALIYLDWHEAWLFKMEYDDPDETSQLMNGQQYTRYLDSL